jgi:hypothetical protein
MRDVARLGLDILISAAFAVFAAAVGFLIGLVSAFVIAPVIFRLFFPDCECPGLGIFVLLIIALPTLMGGVFGFPLCGIWLDQRRQRASSP